MLAFKIMAAVVWTFIVLVCALPMLNNVFSPYGHDAELGFFVWLAMAAVAVWLIHLVVRGFSPSQKAG